ncbi:uncharacterized protein [Primulina eburnea]|uniref:uncharacterized protein isoform X2 n=1 Tax=Primulina eburnea TaxID=1245227 RepID=UPI003C6C597B
MVVLQKLPLPQPLILKQIHHWAMDMALLHQRLEILLMLHPFGCYHSHLSGTKYYPLELARPELKLAGAGLMENLIHGVESMSSNLFREQRLQWRKLFSAVMRIGHCGMPFLPMLILSPFTSAAYSVYPRRGRQQSRNLDNADRFFNALKGHGALCRLVILPFESHGYAA